MAISGQTPVVSTVVVLVVVVGPLAYPCAHSHTHTHFTIRSHGCRPTRAGRCTSATGSRKRRDAAVGRRYSRRSKHAPSTVHAVHTIITSAPLNLSNSRASTHRAAPYWITADKLTPTCVYEQLPPTAPNCPQLPPTTPDYRYEDTNAISLFPYTQCTP